MFGNVDQQKIAALAVLQHAAEKHNHVVAGSSCKLQHKLWLSALAHEAAPQSCGHLWVQAADCGNKAQCGGAERCMLLRRRLGEGQQGVAEGGGALPFPALGVAAEPEHNGRGAAVWDNSADNLGDA